jgi:D-3-phosphoglycerate dehydrogenase
MPVKVLIADKFEEAGRQGLVSLGCEVVANADLTPEALGAALASLDPTIMVVRSKKVGRAALAGARSLKAVIRAGAGYDTIDTAAAADRGIGVCNCPGTNSVAVAELVFGLLLCCDRRIPDQTIDLRNGKWDKKEYSKARGLKGMTLGVVGVGAIGREVIQRAKAFQMRVIAHSLNMTSERARDLGVESGGASRADLHAMLGRCDAVSMHVAANPQSERMCDKAFFAAMTNGAYFINTSRGSIVDEAALAEAVKAKALRVGLDVFANEPSEGKTGWTCGPAALPGACGTHHVGASTDQAQNAVAEEVVRIVRVYKETGRLENRVN